MDGLNIDMASKLKLISRNEIRPKQHLQRVDKETRRLRRSHERVKNSHEREVIRYHKHKRSGSNFFIHVDDPNLISHGKVTPVQSTPKEEFQEMLPVYPQEIFVRTKGDDKILE